MINNAPHSRANLNEPATCMAIMKKTTIIKTPSHASGADLSCNARTRLSISQSAVSKAQT